MTLTFESIVATKKGCAGDLGIFENDYFNALRVVNTYSVSNSGKTLTLIEKGKNRVELIK
jgi:heat shock protein HslJ